MFERYTEKARRVIFFARYEASEFGSPYIETEHLLLGIAREAPYMLAKLAPEHGGTNFSLEWRAELDRLRVGPKTSTSVDIPLSNEAKAVLFFAAEEAELSRDLNIGPEHLLLGLLRERHSASAMLEKTGITLERAREHFGQPSDTPTPLADSDAHGMGAGSGRASGVPFIQFIDAVSGEHVAVVPASAITHLPREGDFLQFEGTDEGTRMFKVNDVRYVFQQVEKRWPYRDHDLTNIVVTVQRVVTKAGP